MNQVIEWFDKVNSNPIMHNIIHIIVALLIMAFLILAGNIIINLIFKEERKNYSEEEKRRIVTLNKISKTSLKILIVTMTLIEILSLFIDVKAILTVAGVGTIAIGIGAKAIVEDILSGFMIIAENMFCVGDYVLMEGNHYGHVENIGLRMTKIRQLDDSVFIIHNGEIKKLTNYSRGTVRAAVLVGVAFEENLESVFEILSHLFENMTCSENSIFLSLPQIMGVEELADSAVMLRIEADVKAENKRKAERELRKKIKEVFDQHHVEIPYSKYVVIPDIKEA